mmetsp:Transcript_10904/g.45222  ORF Transcript_10904/g.45222 Transcript_10904/m.45222 type:complete len:249 (-) Transcript_10904:158-904(-)
MAISRSRPVNSHMCRCVKEFSARNTGPISNTRSKSEQIAICLYSCGDCARQPLRSKYLMLNTFAPPSEVPAMSLGVWISWKPFDMRISRNSAQTPLCTVNIAMLAGVRRSTTRLSRRVSCPTRTYSLPSALSSVSERDASSSRKGRLGSAALTTWMVLTASSASFCVQLVISASGFATVATTSTMLSLVMLDANLIIGLEICTSSANMTACTVAVRWRSTRKQLFPLPRTACTRARTSTSPPARPALS